MNLRQQLIRKKIQIFIIIAVLRQSVKRVCRAHRRDIVLGQHSSLFRRKVVTVASRWQLSVRFDRLRI